ncbi:MAG: serine/threonine protein kinase [Cellvibrionaceae bacterium]
MNRFLDILCAYNNRIHDEEYISAWLIGAIADGESKAQLQKELKEARSSEWISNIIYQELDEIINSDQDLTLVKFPRKNEDPTQKPPVATASESILQQDSGDNTSQSLAEDNDLTQLSHSKLTSKTAAPDTERSSFISNKIVSTHRIVGNSEDETIAEKTQTKTLSSTDDDATVIKPRRKPSQTQSFDTSFAPTEVVSNKLEVNDFDSSINSYKTATQPLYKEASSSTLAIGAIIKDRFILEKKIGHGGMGTVYKARDLRKVEMLDSNPYIAIKFLNDELRDSEDALFALQREAKKSQTLAHPNIVTVHDFDRDGDLAFISMEFLEGKTIEHIISDGFYDKTDHQKIIGIIDKIARGLAYAHQEGFVHADLKPSNIFLTDDGHIKVLDFGIAQAVRKTTNVKASNGSDYQSNNDYTQFDLSSLGAITPTFASLEMLDGQSPVPADDIYSLGCVAYALLTGRHPYLDKNGKKLSAADAFKLQRDIKTIPELSRRHMQALRKALQFHRNERFENAGELIDAIKPPTKLRRWMTITFAVLSITAVLSWWFAVSQTTAVINLDDLPVSMSHIKSTIELGDDSLTAGDVDQAHKLYSQAWESFLDINNVDTRDQYQMKVITDRRIDRITGILLNDIDDKSTDKFRLIQLQLALEFLQKGDLGTRDEDIKKGLIQIYSRLNDLD